MATTAQYTYEEISNTQIKIKVTKTDSNFTQYRIFAYTESGTRIHQEDCTTAKAVAGITISGFIPGENYKINVGPGTDDAFNKDDQIGTVNFTKNVLSYQLQFYYQQDYDFLPITKIEYSLNNRSWTNVKFSATNTEGVTISDDLSVDKYVYIKITKEANTTVTGWYVATDGTTRSSYSTGTNTVTYRYKYDSNNYAMQVNMRAVFQTYRYRILYNSFPYLQYAENQQKVPNLGITGKLIDEVNFYSKYNYLIYYPEYQVGRDGIGWNTVENSTTATYKSGEEKTFTGIKSEDFNSIDDTITLYPVYKNKYTININLYKNDGTSSSTTNIYNNISFYREATGKQYLTTSEILDIRDISPSRDGYVLQGYSKTSGANNNLDYSLISFTNRSWQFEWKSTSQTIKLYAVWAKKYYASFTLHGKGGLFADGQDTNYLTNDLSIGSTKKEPDLPEPTRDGYKLIGWSLDWQTGATVDYELGAEFEYSESGKSYTLYAVWAKEYYYKFIYNAGNGKWPDGSTQKIEDGITLEVQYRGYRLRTDVPISNDVNTTFKYWTRLENNKNIQYEPNSIWPLDFSNNDSIELTFTAQYLKASSEGVVYINGKPYIPYIYTNEEWQECEAWVYSNGWKICIE